MPDTTNCTDSVHEIGFGYVGIGLCVGCSKPRHLFAASHIIGSDRCISCWQNHFYFSDATATLPSVETFPILREYEGDMCAGCCHPIVPASISTEWSGVIAFLRDQVTEVLVHAKCVLRSDCIECDIRYATIQYRDWSRNRTESVHSANLFATNLEVEGDTYCDPCAEKYMEENGGSDNFICCDSCESHVHVNNTGWYSGTRYCDSCIDNNVFDCGDCGESRWDGDDHYCESDDDDDSSLIHSYSYRPSPFFFGEGKYHFGFELEVESRGNGRYDGALTVQNNLGGHAYLKEDGSLSNGFEIVTHPHTLDKYHTEFNWDVLEKLKSDGFRSWNTRTCGLHVHVSRTAFGTGDPWDYRVKPVQRSQMILKRQSHELRFMKLIYDNQRQVERIAGRSNNSYATFADKGQLIRKVKYGNQENGRYSAINTENDDTIEVRVFKGSLRKERVLSALEFVHAAVEYTRDIKVSSKNHALSWLKFTGYVADNADLYPNLVTIMSESFAGDSSTDEN